MATSHRSARTPAPDAGTDRPNISQLITQLDLALRAGIEPIAREFSITTPQYAALTQLSRSPGISSAQLSRRSYVTAQATNEVVSALEGKGLITRSENAENKRIREIHLTSEGRSVLEGCNGKVDLLEARMLSGLGARKPATLLRALQSCLDSLGGQARDVMRPDGQLLNP